MPGTRWRLLGFTAREHVAAWAVFAVVTAVFFFPLAQGETFSEVERRQEVVYPWAGLERDPTGEHVVHFDYVDSFYPWQVHTTRALRDGDLPLWNPYSFGGAPFFANGQSGVLYPPRLALSLAVSPARVHDLLLASHFLLAGVAMFLLLGYVGLSFPSALVGGLAWMLNSFALAWQALEHYTAIAVWLPVGVLLAHALVRRRSWTAAFGLALILALLFTGGNALFVELAVLALVMYAAALAVWDARREPRVLAGFAGRIGLAVLLFVGITALSLLSLFDAARDSARLSLTYDELGDFALAWGDLVNLVRLPRVWETDPYHANLFAGTAVGLLAVVGAFRREVLPRFAAGLAILTVLFMLHTPVTYLAYVGLPGFADFKPLGRAAFLVTFALAVLAAFGLETVLRWLRGPLAASFIRSPFFLGALGGAAVGGVLMRLGRGSLGGSTSLLLALALVLAVALAVHVSLSWRWWEGTWGALRRRAPFRPSVGQLVTLLVAGSIVGQALVLKPHLMPHQPNEEARLFPSTPLVRHLERTEPSRVLAVGPTFRGSASMIFEIPSAGGYESLLPERVQRFWRVVGDGLSVRQVEANRLAFAYHPIFQSSGLRPLLLAKAGVSSVVMAPEEIVGRRVPAGLDLDYDGRDGRVFAVEGAVPRAYLASGCEVVSDPRSALERFASDDLPRGVVVLERDWLARIDAECGGSPDGDISAASVEDVSGNTLRVNVRASSPGWLVLTDSWHEDWSATLDGRELEVLPANHAQRAVRVPAGSHEVRFDFQKDALRLGTILSIVFLVVTVSGLVLGLAWSPMRRRRSSSRESRSAAA